MSWKPAIASMSLGRAWVHALPYKLDCAKDNGLNGIEIFYEDLEYLALSESSIPYSNSPPSPSNPTPTPSPEALLHAAQTSAKTLGTDIIQIPGNFLDKTKITGDLDIVVADLLEVVDVGLKESPVIKFAYENLCWSTFFDTWEKAWELVERVDRPNFGMCLDTFNIAGRLYADPASADGKTPNADLDIKRSLEVLVKKVDVKKVFYIQVVDAEKMRNPLVEGHAFYVEGQPSRMSWSRNARLFYGEEERGAYLPVLDVTKAIVMGLGYTGWVTMELFSRTMNEAGDEVPKDHARRARVAWEKLEKEIERWQSK